MADGEQRANRCGTATFGYDSRRRAFALVGCARFSELAGVVPQGMVRLDRDERREETLLCHLVASSPKLIEECRNCKGYEEGEPMIDKYKGVGEGSDGEYYGGEHQEWTDAIPTAEVQEAMQQMGA